MALISATPIFPLLVSPLVVEIIPLLLTVAMRWTLVRTIPRPGGPGVVRVLLFGRWEGSASAFRIFGFCERPQNVVDIAEDVGVDILLAQCQRLKGGVRLAENFEPVMDRQDRIRRRELFAL